MKASICSRVASRRLGSTAGIGSISFDEIGIELMLTDQKTEAIAEARVPILTTIVICS